MTRTDWLMHRFEDEDSLSHSGTKGMKWGYNKGKRNGKRTAEEDEYDPDSPYAHGYVGDSELWEIGLTRRVQELDELAGNGKFKSGFSASADRKAHTYTFSARNPNDRSPGGINRFTITVPMTEKGIQEANAEMGKWVTAWEEHAGLNPIKRRSGSARKKEIQRNKITPQAMRDAKLADIEDSDRRKKQAEANQNWLQKTAKQIQRNINTYKAKKRNGVSTGR